MKEDLLAYEIPVNTGKGAEQALSKGPRCGLVILFLLFFCSGISALVYEIAWTRRLTLVFGNTGHSVSTTLVAFMGGLAFGSLLFGRIIDKRDDPIRIYAWLEIGIGISAILLPFILSTLDPVYQFLFERFGASSHVLSLSRFVLSTAVLIVPTTFIGATLPVLSKCIVRRAHETSLGIGSLYAANTLGALVGCFLGGFVLLGWIGVSRSEQAAAALNIFIGLVALGLHHRLAEDSSSREALGAAEWVEREACYGTGTRRCVLLAFGISGMLSLAYEVLWTRILTLFLYNSIYSFSMILATYLLGLTVGSFLSARFVDRVRKPLEVFGWLEILIGLCVFGGLQLFGELPFKAYSLGTDPLDYLSTNFMSTFAVILPPTLLMGAVFPIAIRLFTRGLGSIGRQTGTLYSVNTIGAIAGSFVSGFIMIPLLGSKNSIMLLILLNLAVGFFLLCVSMRIEGSSVVNRATSAFLVLPMIGLLFGRDIVKEFSLRSLNKVSERVVVFDEDATAAVAVLEDSSGSKTLVVDGALMDVYSTKTQLMAYLPLALMKNPENLLTICSVPNSTALSAERAGVEVDLVGPQSFVATTLKHLQSHFPGMEEPMAKKIIVDGRSYLLLSDKNYDVITVNPPSPPWGARAANLYTREFYKLCRERLKSGGVVCQWLPTPFTSISEEQYKMFLATFINVFPHTSVWNSPDEAGTYFIGTSEKLNVDAASFSAFFDAPSVRDDLALYSDLSMDGQRVLSLLFLDETAVKDYVAGVPVMSDDLPLMEFPLFRNGSDTIPIRWFPAESGRSG